MLSILEHILGSCISADEWRLMQMVCYCVRFACNRISTEPKIIERSCQILLQKLESPSTSIIKKNLTAEFVRVLMCHQQSLSCDQCSLPQNISGKPSSNLRRSNTEPNISNWPDDQDFIISPLFCKTDNSITISFPKKRTLLQRLFTQRSSAEQSPAHVTQESPVFYLQKPKSLGMLFFS